MDQYPHDINDAKRPWNGHAQPIRNEPKLQLKPWVIVILMIVIVFVGMSFFFREQESLSTNDLDKFHERLLKLEENYKLLEQQNGQIAELQRALSDLTKSDNVIKAKLSRIDKNLQIFEKQVKNSKTIQTKRKYHKVKSGESLLKIAVYYNLTLDELCRLNNIKKNKVIHPGQTLIIGP